MDGASSGKKQTKTKGLLKELLRKAIASHQDTSILATEITPAVKYETSLQKTFATTIEAESKCGRSKTTLTGIKLTETVFTATTTQDNQLHNKRERNKYFSSKELNLNFNIYGPFYAAKPREEMLKECSDANQIIWTSEDQINVRICNPDQTVFVYKPKKRIFENKKKEKNLNCKQNNNKAATKIKTKKNYIKILPKQIDQLPICKKTKAVLHYINVDNINFDANEDRVQPVEDGFANSSTKKRKKNLASKI